MQERLPTAAARPRPDTAASHERAVHRVIAAMHERLDEELSLQTMADVAMMSPFHFNRTFHVVTGLPPRHFLSALRLDRARRLLVTTRQRVTDICLDVGYTSLGTFTRRFTETFGISPRRLRTFAALPTGLPPASGERQPIQADAPGTVDGRLITPADFSGTIFVGLFGSSLPSGAPVACKVMSEAGAFRLDAAPGRYYLYALGIPDPMTTLDLLVLDDALRASAGIVEIPGDVARSPVDLVLRPRAEADPPILVTLPLLAYRNRSHSGTEVTERPEAVA